MIGRLILALAQIIWKMANWPVVNTVLKVMQLSMFLIRPRLKTRWDLPLVVFFAYYVNDLHITQRCTNGLKTMEACKVDTMSFNESMILLNQIVSIFEALMSWSTQIILLYQLLDCFQSYSILIGDESLRAIVGRQETLQKVVGRGIIAVFYSSKSKVKPLLS